MKKLLVLLTALVSTYAPKAILCIEVDLSICEASIYSQNGEDGVIDKIFHLIEPSLKYCVDFGAYDGVTGSNTCLLRREGWDSLLMDRLYDIPEKAIHKEFITAENINDLFAKYSVPLDFGLLSIDIDYNDFYVWQAIDEKYRPCVVVIEYNGTHLPDEDKVAKYRPFFCGGGDNYYGASILALYNLGRSKGYSLVYAEKSGTNLFFIRDDLLAKYDLQFKNINQVDLLYRPPTYGTGPNGGHRPDRRNQPYCSSRELIGGKWQSE